MLKKSLFVLAIGVMLTPIFLNYQLVVATSSYCADERFLYGQDTSWTPGNDNDTAIVNDRNGNRLMTVGQLKDHLIYFPNDYYVNIYANERLAYAGSKNHDSNAILSFNVLDTSYKLIQSYTLRTGNSEVAVKQDGYVQFSKGSLAIESNWLALCPSNSTNAPAIGNRAPIWNSTSAQSVYANNQIQFYVSASDPDGTALTYTAFNLPSGSSFDVDSKLFTWVPSFSQTGNYVPMFRVSDGIVSADTTVQITVYNNNSGGNNYNNNYGNNNPPVWSQIGTQNAYIGQPLRFTVYATDPENNYLNYSAFNLPNGAYFDAYQKSFTWTPQNNQAGYANVTFSVSDGYNAAQYMAVAINVYGGGNSFNNATAPTFVNFNPPLTAVEDQLWLYAFQTMSGNGAPITYRLVSGPNGMFINANTGIVSWVPSFAHGRAEPYKATVAATSGSYESARDFYITVQNAQAIVIPPAFVAAPAVFQPLTIANLKVRKDDSDFLISWNTNKPARARVIYDTVSEADDNRNNYSYANITPDLPANQLSRNHEVRINGNDLTRDAKYYFRAVAKTNGEVVVGSEMTFSAEAGFTASALDSLGKFFTNPWLYGIVAIAFIWLIYKKLSVKS